MSRIRNYALGAATAIGSVVVVANPSVASAGVTGCSVWLETDHQARSNCTGGNGYHRVAYKCGYNGGEGSWQASAWQVAGTESIATCSPSGWYIYEYHLETTK